jgi:hypothetical protein
MVVEAIGLKALIIISCPHPFPYILIISYIFHLQNIVFEPRRSWVRNSIWMSHVLRFTWFYVVLGQYWNSTLK